MTTLVHVRHSRRLSDQTAATAAAVAANLRGWEEAIQEVTSWPEYEPQPLRALPGLAARLGVGQLFYKDESERFARRLGSFKALGAPYAGGGPRATRSRTHTEGERSPGPA